jgi:hypothetical protein
MGLKSRSFMTPSGLRLSIPTVPRAKRWKPSIVATLSAVDEALKRTDPTLRPALRAADVLGATVREIAALAAKHRALRRMPLWLDYHIYKTLGRKGLVRALGERFTWADWEKIVTKYGQSYVEYSKQHAGLVSRQLRVPVFSQAINAMDTSTPTERTLQHFPPTVAGSVYSVLAQALRGRCDSELVRDSDLGNKLDSRWLSGWMTDVLHSPLSYLCGSDGCLAVSILLDCSSSTQRYSGLLWHAASSLNSALRDAGHATAVDCWGSKPIHAVHDQGPLVGWDTPTERMHWRRPQVLNENTALVVACNPRLQRLQATAPMDRQRIAIVITDGDLDPNDERKFLELASVPCVYWEVRGPRPSAKSFQMRNGQHWAWRAYSDREGVYYDAQELAAFSQRLRD